jgi:hypothetical protein
MRRETRASWLKDLASEYWPMLLVGVIGLMPDLIRLVKHLKPGIIEIPQRPNVIRWILLGVLVVAAVSFVSVFFVRLWMRWL